MDCLNPQGFSEHEHVGQDQNTRAIWHGPNMFMDVCDRMKIPGALGVAPMPHGYFGQEQSRSPALYIFLHCVFRKCILAPFHIVL